MAWCVIRLELAPMADFPAGSAARVFLLRLPLDTGGRIDGIAFDAAPRLATVRRYWPKEPDREGQVVRRDGRWLLRFPAPDREDTAILEPGEAPFRLGSEVTITETGGQPMPFRVARCE